MQKVTDTEFQSEVMYKFKSKFIKDEISFIDENGIRNLLWCYFKDDYKNNIEIIKTIEIPKIDFSPELHIYIYFDRSEELFKTTFSDFCQYLLKLEEWEYTDAEIFDESLEWVIGMTHDDVSMLLGFQQNE